MHPSGTRSIHFDQAAWEEPPKADDFLVAVGKTKSNTVYHIVSVRAVPHKERRAVRYYLRVLHSDLLTAIRREDGQRLMTMRWNSRDKQPK